MIPLVGFKKELDLHIEVVHRVAKKVVAGKSSVPKLARRLTHCGTEGEVQSDPQAARPAKTRLIRSVMSSNNADAACVWD